MKICREPREIYSEYLKCVEYNESINLYDNVRRNENFFNDKQWDGVNAPDLDKPVFNFLKPVVNYYVSMLVSDDIAVQIKSAYSNDDKLMRATEREIERVMETAKVRPKQRRMLRNAAVDGDGCFYIYFDPDMRSSGGCVGEICVENIENTHILAANPVIDEIQNQPFVIIEQIMPVESVRDEAVFRGMSRAEAESICADCETDPYSLSSDDVTTVLIKLWKENGTVRMIKCTRNMVVCPETDTGYMLYPVVMMNWEKMRNSYHGMAVVTGKISNQIFVNKLYAMAMQYVKHRAFPKLLYDKSKIPRWSSKIGDVIAVNGNPNEAIAANFVNADMSPQVLELIDRTIAQTKELMGASDAALGNVKPDNTSAIIAVQKAAAISLELQKAEFYRFVEDYIRIFIDIMRVNYGVRDILTELDDGTVELVSADFSRLEAHMMSLNIEIGAASYWSELMQVQTLDNLFLKGIIDEELVSADFSRLEAHMMSLNIEIGAASYWSELMQVQTLDNLFLKGIIDDSITYLESMPDGYIRNKRKIIASLKNRREAEAEKALKK